MGAVFGRGTSLSLSLSRCSHFLASLWAKFKGLFAHFIVVSSRFIVNFSHFVVVLTHLFSYKRHFLGHYAFLKFLNALFLGFLRLLLRAVCAKTAWQSINLALFLLFGLPRKAFALLAMTANFVILSVATQRVARCKPQQKNPQRLKENLPFLDTSLTLSMTNSGFCLKIMDIFTQILKQKFKFFTQNSRHFINSTHSITLSQILSLTQGFFIFLPQIFAQCKLINFNTRRKNGR